MTSVLRDILTMFRRRKGAKGLKPSAKMSSEAAVDDVDLIDLESGVAASCVPRVTVPDATPEEQEHLLDVCPPKLEQKLSLTRRSHDQPRNDNQRDAAGNVLVTLGHDQVVPVRKRIDVVSSDTIKRVRDITKNLEPVISIHTSEILKADGEDKVDFGATKKTEDDEASYETREINDAFNFLSELDDNEEQYELSVTNDYEKILNSPKSSSFSKENVSYPLEPTCFIEEAKSDGSGFVFDNEAFESSPPSKINGQLESNKRPASLNFDFDGLRAARNSFKRLRSFTCSAVGFDVEPWKKKSKSCPYRKSWSEGSSARKSRCSGDLVGRRKRTYSERLDDEKVTKKDQLSSKGQSVSSIGVSLTATSHSGSSSSAASSCSEVDWSWVEEVEPECGRRSTTAAHQHQQSSNAEEPSAAAAAAAIGGNSPTCSTGGARMRSRQSASRDQQASVAMSVAAAGKTSDERRELPSDNRADNVHHQSRITEAQLLRSSTVEDPCVVDLARINAAPANDSTSNGGTLPWLRASMRRLRQLRLPGTQDTSQPNSLPDIALIAPEILAAQTNDTTGGLLRPSSAPAPVRSGTASATAAAAPPSSNNAQLASSPRRGRRCQQQRSTSSNTRSASSGAESTSTCASSAGSGAGMSSSASSASSTNPSPQHQANRSTSPRRVCDNRQRDAERDDERGEDEDEDENNPLGRWPHALSPALACLGCTLGLFNISRFAILSIQFGANFIVQFLILSLVIGIPLLTLQVCLGQRLAAGAVDMWKISPLFQGVGIALLAAQAFIGIYSIVGVSWMFVYFRDSFITKQDRYRWAEPFALYREDIRPTNSPGAAGSGPNGPGNNNSSYKLSETVPDYFNGAVLQRHHLNEPDPGVVTLKFQVAFNLAVVWMIVFVSLSKGLRSYGKVVYVFTLVPIFGTLVLCTKLLGLTPPGSLHQLFPGTVWAEFFINGRSWVAASSEVFLTWGLLGAAAMQIAAHNKHKHLLQRDTSLVVVLTFVVLLLAAFLANTCVQILKYHGYIYTTSSFERISSYMFLRPINQPSPSGYSSTPERFMAHASFIVGQRVSRPGAELTYESGYQVLRLSTELVPATLAVLGTEQVSPFWAVLFYFILILFGIAQQLAIWHCVITGIMAINTKMMKLWETTITFFSCACAYILGLPMATEFGIYVVYYLDYTVGGAWWILVLYLVQVAAVFAVRGRPHTGDAVVAELFPPTGRCLRYWAGPLLSFTWNVVLPITLMVLSITIFKSTGYRELYTYRRMNKDYWSIWARQLGASIQLIPILMIPVVAVIQTCRYLNNGPPDIFDSNQVEVNVSHCNQCNGRIQLLYRPSLEPDDQRNGQTQLNGAAGGNLHGNGLVSSTTELPFEDPPPKYTPPPSYTTATGARIAKMLRQSFRRSVRRIANVLGEGGSAAAARNRPALQQQPPPPDYAAVLVEMNQSVSSRDIAIHIAEIRPDVADSRRPTSNHSDRLHPHPHNQYRSNTIDRSSCRDIISTIERPPMNHRGHYTVDRNAGRRPYNNSHNNASSNLTAAEVANLLRSSIRRNAVRRSFHQQQQQQQPQNAVSVENLVEAAAPIARQNSLVKPPEQRRPTASSDKTADEMESSVSVI
ncbi:uncharacterized protein LOC100123368 isoform X2 [Nasonia vitripennis]|uniref:Uncharacterized protein n=1 Tax=Nasonia vitripennis TaxID=7425 RepID=A0A7M7IXX7_NASVI|nr:uncharacterized protein LOC100123368 isoform X2 [Nasonia vitripennis]